MAVVGGVFVAVVFTEVVVGAVEAAVDEKPFLLRTLALKVEGNTLVLVDPLVGGVLSVLPFVCSSLGRLRGSSFTRDKAEVYEAE